MGANSSEIGKELVYDNDALTWGDVERASRVAESNRSTRKISRLKTSAGASSL